VSADPYLLEWLRKARNDLVTADYLLSMPDTSRVSESVCFHYQQAAEKYLKSYLVSKGTKFKKIHNLEYLIQLCAQTEPRFASLDVGGLSGYAVDVRYPEGSPMPTASEMRECRQIAEDVRRLVLSAVGESDDYTASPVNR
jgi:HEPN domain-containing protein